VLERAVSDGLEIARFTAEQFEAARNLNAFGDRRVELLDGYVVDMGGQYIPHGWVKRELFLAFRTALLNAGSDLTVDTEFAVRVSEWNEPVPDLIVWDAVRLRGPVPLDRARLVAEISDSSLRYDMGRKVQLYAQAGIAEYWVVDVARRTIRQHWSADNGSYRQHDDFHFGEFITSPTLPGVIVSTLDLD